MSFSHPKLVPAKPMAVFSDFDGTIAHPDTLNFLAERFGGTEFRREVERKIASGEVTLRDGIQQEVAQIQGTLDDVVQFLREHVEIDPAFPAFSQWCLNEKIPVTVLSAGMKEVIESLLRPFNLDQVRILANSLQIENGKWSLRFVDETPWGHDKGSALRQAKADGFRTVFLGDGLSDRRGALEADLVFAKAGLARFCAEQNLPFKAFNNFSEVQEVLTQILA
jgi:HAD superfamily phosphoserine phosphatase-like hydrolase